MKKIVKYCFVIFMLVSSLNAQGPVQHSGKVLEAINSGGYTYMQIDEKHNKFWIAVKELNIQKGAIFTFTEQVWMTGFKSQTLNKTFEVVFDSLS